MDVKIGHIQVKKMHRDRYGTYFSFKYVPYLMTLILGSNSRFLYCNVFDMSFFLNFIENFVKVVGIYTMSVR